MFKFQRDSFASKTLKPFKTVLRYSFRRQHSFKHNASSKSCDLFPTKMYHSSQFYYDIKSDDDTNKDREEKDFNAISNILTSITFNSDKYNKSIDDKTFENGKETESSDVTNESSIEWESSLGSESLSLNNHSISSLSSSSSKRKALKQSGYSTSESSLKSSFKRRSMKRVNSKKRNKSRRSNNDSPSLINCAFFNEDLQSLLKKDKSNSPLIKSKHANDIKVRSTERKAKIDKLCQHICEIVPEDAR